jgi:hypothetical protein
MNLKLLVVLTLYLRSITKHLAIASAQCTRAWRETLVVNPPSIPPDLVWPLKSHTNPSTSSPIGPSIFEPGMSGAGIVDENAKKPGIEDTSSQGQDCYQNDASEVPSLDRLKSRGKGNYICPQGMNCKKGGAENGTMKIFTRNSDFRYVLCPALSPSRLNLKFQSTSP